MAGTTRLAWRLVGTLVGHSAGNHLVSPAGAQQRCRRAVAYGDGEMAGALGEQERLTLWTFRKGVGTDGDVSARDGEACRGGGEQHGGERAGNVGDEVAEAVHVQHMPVQHFFLPDGTRQREGDEAFHGDGAALLAEWNPARQMRGAGGEDIAPLEWDA